MTYFAFTETPQDIAAHFKTDLSRGLSAIEAQSRLKKTGPNLLIKQKKLSPFIIFFRQLNSLVTWVLLGAVIISFLGDVLLLESGDLIATDACHHVPILQEIFGITSVSFTESLLWIGLGMIPLILLELYKMF